MLEMASEEKKTLFEVEVNVCQKKKVTDNNLSSRLFFFFSRSILA